MGMLTFYCATNCEDLRVINGNERGSLLNDLQNYLTLDKLKDLNKRDVFLDQTTGDYFSYKSVKFKHFKIITIASKSMDS